MSAANEPEEDDDDEAPPSTPLARIELKRPVPAEDGMVTAVRTRRSMRPSMGAQTRRVLLVARDALARSSLARDLVVLGCDVRSVAPGDIATCKGVELDVVVVEAPERELRAAIATVRRWFPDAPMMVRADATAGPPISTRDGAPHEIVARNAPVEEMIAAIDRLRGDD
jgi:hypothetical protein